MPRLLTRIFWTLGVVAACDWAAAGFFTYESLVDTTHPYGFSGIAPYSARLNDSGTVAFQANRSGGTGIYTLSGGTVTAIAGPGGPAYTFLGRPESISNDGRVLFEASGGLYVGNGGSTVQITPAGTGKFVSIGGGTMNRAGTDVVFRGYLNSSGSPDRGQGIYREPASGGITQTVYELPTATQSFSLVGVPSVNNNGVIAFGGDDPSDLNFKVLSGTAGNLTTRMLFDSSSHGAVDINDAGDLLVYGNLTGAANPFGIYHQALGGATQMIAGVGSLFRSLEGTPDINNDGVLAFMGHLVDGRSGIFTGGDVDADKVLIEGDALFGSTLTEVSFFRGGLNENGQIAFGYTLADGRSGIGLAAPAPAAVPEPSSLVLLLVVGGAAGACRIRRNRRAGVRSSSGLSRR